MKFLSIILSFLILFTGFLPCPDNSSDCCAATSEVETVCAEMIANDFQNDKDQEDKDCGPNCLCFCCAAAYTLTDKMIASSDFSYLKNESNTLKSNYIFSFSQNIWHPPIT